MIGRASFAPCAHSLFVVVAGVFFAGAVMAAGGTVSVHRANPNPELSVRTIVRDAQPAPATALDIAMLNVEVAITGGVARTTVTTKFIGNSDADIEGTFTFDMPPNSVVTGYALDIGDKMMDGVLVGQRKARQVFDARVRAGIDPGLAEVTRTGAFRTRVFPIRRQGRTVRLEFVTPLDPSRDLSIPLVTQSRVREFSVRVITDAAQPPKVRGPNGIDLDWRPSSGGGLEAEGHARNAALSGALVVTAVPAPAVQVARAASGDVFFDISDVVATGRAKPPPERVRIYWDVSRSHRDADLDKEIALVGRYIDEVRPGKVDLVLFSSGPAQVRSFDAPSAGQITAVLKAVDYQGGTEFIPEPYPQGAKVCLLFSDANRTAGWFRPLERACQWFAVSSAADANRAYLSVLAQRSGGDYIDLRTETADDALLRVAHPLPTVRSVGVSSEKGDDTHADYNYVVVPAGLNRIRIIGRTSAQGAGLITILLAGAAQDVRQYNVNFAAAKPDDALAQLWAARQIDQMTVDGMPQDQVVAFSQRYGVASQAASFVVFENLSDYVEAGVAPPSSAGDAMIAEYGERKRQHDEQVATAERERLDDVAALWDEQKQWWVRPPIPARPKRAEAGESRDDVARTEAPRPPSPAVPPPAESNAITAAPAPASAPDVVVETTVVTGSRAPQQGLVSASPLEVVGSQEVQAGTATSTERLINQLPQSFADTGAGDGAGRQRPTIGVTIAKWDPKRPYIVALNKAQTAEYAAIYRAQEREHGTLPAFYLDVAEFLFRHGKRADAIPVALNALELPTADSTTMTIVADRMMRYGDDDRAIWLYEQLIELDPDRPQPLRNLALALIARADRTGARAESAEARRRDYARAVELLNTVITRPWADAFEGIEVIALMEANRAVKKLRALGVTKVALDKRLIADLDVDLRVVLEWNTDATDMDLWVDEPTGERAVYDNPKTRIGGRLSNDMTAGYGPEEYLLHRAPAGNYTVRVNVYNTDRLDPNGATTVRAHIFRNYGRRDEREELLELELTRDGTGDPGVTERDGNGRAHRIGTIRVGPRRAARVPDRHHRP